MKKFLFGAAVVAAAGFGTFTANQNNNEEQLSQLQLENIEILADAESEDDFKKATGGNCLPVLEKSKCKVNGVIYTYATYVN
jgi:hypothetical protein